MNTIKKLTTLYKIKKNNTLNSNINYIYNIQFFFKKKIKLIFPLLIPKLDTENISHILEKIIRLNYINIIELGFGTSNLNASLENKNIRYTSIDNNFFCYIKSKEKYKNLILNNLLLLLNKTKRYNTLISNPPYLSKKEFIHYYQEKKNLENSLISKKKGLKIINTIINHTYQIIKINGNIVLEHSYKQGKKIRQICKIYGCINGYTKKDYMNLQRLTWMEI